MERSKALEESVDQTLVSRIRDFCKMDHARTARHSQDCKTQKHVHRMYALTHLERELLKTAHASDAPHSPNQSQVLVVMELNVCARAMIVKQIKGCLRMDLAKTAQLGMN